MDDYRGQFIFLNNAIGHFYRGFLDWFASSFYAPCQTKIISTYTKGISKLNQRLNNQDKFDVVLPAVILDPSGEIVVDDRQNHLWRYDSLQSRMAKDVFDYLYKDDEVTITPVFNRYIGEMEVTILLRSIYEYLDMRLYIIQSFNNENRYNRPFIVNTFLVLPQELIDLKYNTADGTLRGLDWSTALMENRLIENINKTQYTVPLVLTPIFKYTSISDSSNAKSVGSELEEYKISLSVTYELDLPVYFYVQSDYKITVPATLSIGTGYVSKKLPNIPDQFVISSDDEHLPKASYKFEKTLYFDISDEAYLSTLQTSGFVIPELLEDTNCIKILNNSELLYIVDNYYHDANNIQHILFSDSYKSKLVVGDHVDLVIYSKM